MGLGQIANDDSAPAGVIAIFTLQLLFPRGFPNNTNEEEKKTISTRLRALAKRVDYLGAVLLLTASVLLVVGLENAGLRHPWRSAVVAAPLTISGTSWIMFLVWERRLTLAADEREPVMPWRFFNRRLPFGLLL